MMKNTMIALLCMCMTSVTSVSAQSPVAYADGTYKFSYYAPMADEVTLQGTGALHKCKMQRQSDGVWTYTTPTLPSDMYAYNFLIDEEVAQLDPGNQQVVRDIDNYYNVFFVQGYPANYYMESNVPHGRITKVWYPSTLNGMQQRRMSVYLPAEYDSNPDKRYPVLYLLHGSGGDENSWLDMGRLAQIMDNMLAEGKCLPMIVVMPNGNVELDAAPGESPYMQAKPKANNVSSMTGRIETAFPREVMTYVEQHYRTINDKEHRAIAGLSLGGLHTLFITANNPELFDYVGLFSAQTTNALNDKKIRGFKGITKGLRDLASQIPVVGEKWENKLCEKFDRYSEITVYDSIDQKLSAQFATPPSLYYIAVGKDDYVKKLVDMHRERLDAAGYKYYYNESDGGHTWNNWRKYLLDLLPRLFVGKI